MGEQAQMRIRGCVLSACREGGGAKPDKPGVGGSDSDCCASRNNGGCDAGYTHSIVNSEEWNRRGGRPDGFYPRCDGIGGGNTCCSKRSFNYKNKFLTKHISKIKNINININDFFIHDQMISLFTDGEK